ncbi:hypothetical protein CP083_01890 [Candidatus Bathyarchaeota archaeon B24-2]|nr:MAG: hypothetical protein CP083_01890 [Candidatus Bathyarchaeota archaeon B24-2]
MTYRRLVGMRGKRGISPVIATVILVAVAITVAVSVAFWMGGITGQYTRFEKLQVQDPVIVKSSDHWNLTFTVKNVGSTDATIEELLINGEPFSSSTWNVNGSQVTNSTYVFASSTESGLSTVTGSNSTISVTIESGNTYYIRVRLGASLTSSGTALEFKFRTASGYEYPKMVTLP